MDLKGKVMKFLQDDSGNLSSMRLNVRVIVFVSAFILIASGVYIIIKSFDDTFIPIEVWSGIGIFITSIAGLLTGVMYNQRSQKKIEAGKAAKPIEKDQIINEAG